MPLCGNEPNRPNRSANTMKLALTPLESETVSWYGSEDLPFLQGNAAADDDFYLSDKDAQLGHGILGVGGNGEAIGAPYHEVMLPADKRTVKAEPPQATDEVPPLTRRPPALGWP